MVSWSYRPVLHPAKTFPNALPANSAPSVVKNYEGAHHVNAVFLGSKTHFFLCRSFLFY